MISPEFIRREKVRDTKGLFGMVVTIDTRAYCLGTHGSPVSRLAYLPSDTIKLPSNHHRGMVAIASTSQNYHTYPYHTILLQDTRKIRHPYLTHVDAHGQVDLARLRKAMPFMSEH